MTKRSEQVFDDLIIEYADENLQVNINSDLLRELKINKAALTRFANQWIDQNKAKWTGTNTLQLIIGDERAEEEDLEIITEPVSINTEFNKELKLKNQTDSALLEIQDSIDVPETFINMLIEILEVKFQTKLTNEIHQHLKREIKTLEQLDNVIRKIHYKSIPFDLINNYLDYVIKDL